MALAVYVANGYGHWTLVAGGRLVFGLLVAAVIARMVRAAVWQRPEPWGWVRVIAAAVGVPAAFYSFAQLPPADAVTLMNTGPLWAVLIHAGLQRRLPSIDTAIVLLMAASGVVLMRRPELAGVALATGIALFNGVCRGVAIVSVGRIVNTPATVLVFQANIGALLTTAALFPFMANVDGAIGQEPLVLLGLIVLVAVLATLARIAATRGIRLGATHSVAPLLYLSPAFALAAQLLFLDHETELRHILGIGLIISGALWLSLSDARSRLHLYVQTTAGRINRDTFEAMAHRFVDETEAAAMVELQVHAERSVVDPVRRAEEVFEAGELGQASRGHGLLVCFFTEPATVVLVGDHFVEQRIDHRRLERRLRAAQDSADCLATLSAELRRALPTRGTRENEVPNEVTVSGF